MINIRFSCVVDDNPLFRMQALTWVWTILAGGLACPEKIVVYLVEGNYRDFDIVLNRLGVTVRRVKRFGTGAAVFCNKLLQLDSAELTNSDCVVMCDTDIAFAGDIRQWITTTHIRAKVVDSPHPGLDVLERLYSTTGLTAKPCIVETAFRRGLTFNTNCNGGIYMIPTKWFEALAGAWVKWARYALERGDILGDRRINADQIGFCFAMLELGLPFDPLPENLNFPTHFAIERYSALPKLTPMVLHYHKCLDQSGFLLPLGLTHVDTAITRVNSVIADHRRRQFDNRTFWDYRYAYHPASGSGAGSRGDSLSFKRCVLRHAIVDQNPDSILDIGCGDQFVTEDIPDARYTGIDLSPVVVERARKQYPARHYIIGDFLDQHLSQYALTLCLDVVIHIDSIDRYREFVSRMVSITIECGIITGYEARPNLSSEITFFHEPLSETLRKAGAINLRNLGRYRDTDIWHFSTAHDHVIC
jgi:SAM-dependent methyltransferase